MTGSSVIPHCFNVIKVRLTESINKMKNIKKMKKGRKERGVREFSMTNTQAPTDDIIQTNQTTPDFVKYTIIFLFSCFLVFLLILILILLRAVSAI